MEFPMVMCNKCKKRFPADNIWEYATFSADEGQRTFRLCIQCNKEKGNSNIQEYADSLNPKK